MKRSCVVFALVLVVAGLSCDSGTDPEESPSGQTPSIFDLRLSPDSASYLQNGGSTTVTGTLEFFDPDGDLAGLVLTISSGSIDTIPIAGATGVIRGTLQGSAIVSTLVIGSYTVSVKAFDAAGHVSNTLSATFRIGVDESGEHWTHRISGTSAQLLGVTSHEGFVVAVGQDGTILTARDLNSWSQRPSGTDRTLHAVAWVGSEYIAVGERGTMLASPDGLTWTSRDPGITEAHFHNIASAQGRVVVVGGRFRGGDSLSTDACILTSPDGMAWTQVDPDIRRSALYGVASSGSRFVAVGLPQSFPVPNVIAASGDGITWAPVDAGGSGQPLFDVCRAGLTFVIVGPLGTAYTSADGLAWTSVPTSSSGIQYGATWSGKTIVSVGWDINTSNDGVNWQQQLQTPNHLRDVVWTGLYYVAVGDAGEIMTSP